MRSVCDFVGYLRGERRLYWDMTDETRAFAKRYKAAFDGRISNEAQASTYSSAALSQGNCCDTDR
ncbi:hypothetical protein ACVWYQ_003638 [Bradyrhizobium sp. USDA 3397]